MGALGEGCPIGILQDGCCGLKHAGIKGVLCLHLSSLASAFVAEVCTFETHVWEPIATCAPILLALWVIIPVCMMSKRWGLSCLFVCACADCQTGTGPLSCQVCQQGINQPTCMLLCYARYSMHRMTRDKKLEPCSASNHGLCLLHDCGWCAVSSDK